MLPAARNGGHLGMKEVRYWHSERIRFDSNVPMPIHTDGEVQSTTATEIEISVDPGALSVIVPAEAVGNL